MVLLHQRIAIGGFDAPQRQQRASFFFSASLPAMMRQSETRRLMYCQICSLNSGWFRICLNTDMSGSMRPITRV